MSFQSLVAGARPHRRRMRAVLAVATGAAASLLAAVPASAAPPAPAGVAGNPQSPTVALMANEALTVRDVYVVTDDAESYHRYQQALTETADAVAYELAADPVAVRSAFANADLDHQTAVLAALAQLGVEYASATSQPGVGFDCSGLTAYAWSRAGYTLPRQSGAQMDVGTNVDAATASVGDLVQYPGHVMMYLGVGDAIVHAANPGADVEMATLGDRGSQWVDPSS